jgi:hypothetical protein
VELIFELAIVGQINDAEYELVSQHVILVKYFKKSLGFSVPLGEVPGICKPLRVGYGLVEVLVK